MCIFPPSLFSFLPLFTIIKVGINCYLFFISIFLFVSFLYYSNLYKISSVFKVYVQHARNPCICISIFSINNSFPVAHARLLQRTVISDISLYRFSPFLFFSSLSFSLSFSLLFKCIHTGSRIVRSM